MRDGVKVSGAFLVANPKALLAGGFETGIVSFTLGAKCVDRFEVDAVAVDGKAVVIRDGDVFGAAAILFPIVPIFVVAGAGALARTLERAAEFLAGTVPVECFAIVEHAIHSFDEYLQWKEFK